MSSAQILDAFLAVALLGWIMVRQVQPRPVVQRKLVILPLVLLIIGITQVSKAIPHGQSLTSTEVTWLAVDLVVAALSGLARAFTVRLYERDGELWRQGNRVTVALWLVAIGARILIGVLGGHAGAGRVLDDGLLLSFGVTLAVQYGLIFWRGQQSGIPFAAGVRPSC